MIHCIHIIILIYYTSTQTVYHQQVGLMYMFTRIAVNVPQVYLPLYLTSSLSLKKESIAYYPLMMLICSVIGSFLTRPLSKYLGKKGTYVIGAVLIMGSSFWFQFQVTRSCIVCTMYIQCILHYTLYNVHCIMYMYTLYNEHGICTYCNIVYFHFLNNRNFQRLRRRITVLVLQGR